MFRRDHPRYAGTDVLDELRRSDFARLERGDDVYLDYTGGGLYAASQFDEHIDLLRANVFGNPHSVNPTSAARSELVERARTYVLDFFGASADGGVVYDFDGSPHNADSRFTIASAPSLVEAVRGIVVEAV